MAASDCCSPSSGQRGSYRGPRPSPVKRCFNDQLVARTTTFPKMAGGCWVCLTFPGLVDCVSWTWSWLDSWSLDHPPTRSNEKKDKGKPTENKVESQTCFPLTGSNWNIFWNWLPHVATWHAPNQWFHRHCCHSFSPFKTNRKRGAMQGKVRGLAAPLILLNPGDLSPSRHVALPISRACASKASLIEGSAWDNSAGYNGLVPMKLVN